jgi:hypothetical protein
MLTVCCIIGVGILGSILWHYIGKNIVEILEGLVNERVSNSKQGKENC